MKLTAPRCHTPLRPLARSVVVGTVTAAIAGGIFIPLTRSHIQALEAEREAEAELAVEAGKKAASGAATPEEDDIDHGGAKPVITRTASGRVVSGLQRTASQLSLAAASIKNSRAGQAIARNRVFKWITYGARARRRRRLPPGVLVRPAGSRRVPGARRAHPLPPPPPLRPSATGINYDMHTVLDATHANHNSTAAEIWDNAEAFDWRAETVFKCAASPASFARCCACTAAAAEPRPLHQRRAPPPAAAGSCKRLTRPPARLPARCAARQVHPGLHRLHHVVRAR